ncbi:hypothetical protein [Singulisphaera sp. PoT]|uniref:hypothetical protein n=1 Tax=Singulisphaera sp. PoT TaxID=3411797 RepID=UPI003BF51E86
MRQTPADMKKTLLILGFGLGLAFASAAIPGCGSQDPGQPSVGSISIDARSDADDDKPLVSKKPGRAGRNPR